MRPEPPPSAELDSTGSGAPAKRLLSISLGFALSGVFLWLALRETDLRAVAATLSHASLWPLVPCAVALIAFFWLKVERWRRLIHTEEPLARGRLVVPMMMGFAANNVFPLRAGELVRVLVAGHYLALSRTRVLASLLVERVLDALSIAMLTCVALVYVQLGNAASALDARLLVTASIAIAVSGGALLVLSRAVRLDPSRLGRHLPVRWSVPVTSFARQFVIGLEPIARGRALWRILANSLVQWLLLGLCVYLSIGAVGIEIRSGSVALIVLGLVALGISIPSGPAYVGNMEYAFVLGLGFFDIPPADALAAAIYYHAFMFTSVTSVGAACWVFYALTGPARRAVPARD